MGRLNKKQFKLHLLCDMIDRINNFPNDKDCYWWLYKEDNWYGLFLSMTEREIKTYLNRNLENKPIEKVLLEVKLGEGFLVTICFKK